MNIYKILKINHLIKNHRIKFLGLWLLSKYNQRYLSIQLDPVLACNLKCTMCYFSDPEFVRNKVKGQLTLDELEQIGVNFFPNTLRLQIGCGAEPTLYKNIDQLILKAKFYKVPHVSMVSNGNLLTKEKLSLYVANGLNELILSLHGVTKSSYEKFMVNAKYETFINLLDAVNDIKQQYPNFLLRINYTFNEDNFNELFQFFEVFGKYNIDIIQLRPIDKIGESVYNNFSLKQIEKDYLKLYAFFKATAITKKINLIAPTTIIRNIKESLKVKTNNDSSFLIPYTYCYIGPDGIWKPNFDIKKQSFKQWKKTNHWDKQIWNNVFASREKLFKTQRNMINYDIDIN